MSFKHYSLMFLLVCSTLDSYAMEKEEKSQLSEEFYQALCSKRSFLAGSLEAHRNMRASLDRIQSIARNKNKPQICNFCEELIYHGFAKVPTEFEDIKALCNHIRNASNFFRKDEEYIEDKNLTSDSFIKQLSQNFEVLVAYNNYKEKKDRSSADTFINISGKHLFEIIAKYGFRLHKLPSHISPYSIPQFLELNATNQIIYDKANFKKTEQLIRSSFIAVLTFQYLTDTNDETETGLAWHSEVLERHTKNLDSKSADECIIL
jgi:hypothetical protein